MSAPIRVLNFLFDDRYGGPHKRVIEVGRRLAHQGVETVLVLPEGTGNAEGIAAAAGIAVRRVRMERVPSPRDVRRIVRWLLSFAGDLNRFTRLIASERPAVVHVNGAFFFAPALAARRCRVPLVWHLNDTIVPSGVAGLLGRLVHRLADRVVVAAEAVAVHYGIASLPHDVLYAPVDVELYPEDQSARAPHAAAWRVGLIGNWNPLKGHEYFVRAAAEARRVVGDRLRPVLAGSRLATHEEHARRVDAAIAETGMQEVLEDRGFVSNIETLIPELSVLVLSSTSEACPMVVLEGMAAGLPVVATDVGGVRELLLGEVDAPAGIVVPARSPERLAAALVELYRDPLRAAAMGASGRRRARRLYSVQAIAAQHREVYLGVLRSGGGESGPPRDADTAARSAEGHEELTLTNVRQ